MILRKMFENIFSKSKENETKAEKEKPVVIVDIHEKNSLVLSELVALGVQAHVQKLEVGDYIAGDVVIERKTMPDFVSSMLSKRLREQLINLKRAEKPLLIVENFDFDYDVRINQNCIKGFIMSIMLNYQIPVLFTKDSQDTADYLFLLAKKDKHACESLRLKRRTLNKKELARYILEGFPGIGPATAGKLLKKFGSIKAIINASEEELKKEIGKKAEAFKIVDNLF
jgi:ERCC4-type nuclease